MRQALNLLPLLLISVMFLGCTARKPKDEDLLIRYRSNVEASLKQEQDARDSASGQNVVRMARSAIGTPYVPGGRKPGGFDCSGLVQWAYQSVGVKLPRTAREQSVIGQRIMRVEDMRAGDIVAFRHPRRGYHTGIYVGDGKFVHSPRRRSSVKISSLSDPYFNTTFLGARRVSMSGASGEDLVAQAESRMEQYTEERMVRDMERSRASRQKATAESRKKSRDKAQSARQGKKKDSVSKPSEQRKKTQARASSQSKKSKEKARSSSARKKEKARASSQGKTSKEKARASSARKKKSASAPSAGKGKASSRSSREKSSSKTRKTS
ncbi:NlpC/P60 family protein [uncultured Desulfovibrio sp.]|uniref:C40 family peptidase n=1 Tax=Candidatus Desulfovibrio intestinavium TaxID=2838534 RepID=A0A9D2HPJ4_9BACT|nr:NlpC/P60 family protein [uncultured Desulfovibrio sp.]HJA79448.1 C40 family peptidase [Candidatus Desulfovibrio intestinavium]